MVRGRIGGRGRENNGIRQRALFLEDRDDSSNVRLFLANGDVNAIQRPIIFVAGSFRGFVQARLADDGVHAESGFASRTVADDQFALAAPDWNHGVHSHDAGLDGLADGFASDNAGGDFLDRIGDLGFDRTFAIERLAKDVHDAAEHGFADWNLKEFTSRADFVAFLDPGVVAENNHADFSFFQVQSEADDAVSEVEHFIEHRVGETFDFGHTVANFANGSDVLLHRRGFYTGDLGFNIL